MDSGRAAVAAPPTHDRQRNTAFRVLRSPTATAGCDLLEFSREGFRKAPAPSRFAELRSPPHGQLLQLRRTGIWRPAAREAQRFAAVHVDLPHAEAVLAR